MCFCDWKIIIGQSAVLGGRNKGIIQRGRRCKAPDVRLNQQIIDNQVKEAGSTQSGGGDLTHDRIMLPNTFN